MNKYYERYRSPCYLDAVSDGDDWITSCYWNNCLYRIAKDGGDVRYITDLNFDKNVIIGKYSHMEETDDLIILTPQNSYTIAIYDKKNKTARNINITPSNHHIGYGCVGCVLNEGYLYIFSCYCDVNPVRINLQYNIVDELFDWKNVIAEYKIKSEYVVNSAIKCKNEIWIGIQDRNLILRYFIADNRLEILRLQNSNYRIHKLICMNDNIWVLPNCKQPILRLDLENNKEIEYNNYPLEVIAKYSIFITAVEYGDFLLLMPKYGRYLINLDVKSGKMQYIDTLLKDFVSFEEEKNRYFFQGKVSGDYIYIFPYKTNKILRVDMKSLKITLIENDFDKSKSLKEIMYLQLIENNSELKTYEEDKMPLDLFIYKTDNMNEKDGLSLVNDSNGKRIWNICRRDL